MGCSQMADRLRARKHLDADILANGGRQVGGDGEGSAHEGALAKPLLGESLKGLATTSLCVGAASLPENRVAFRSCIRSEVLPGDEPRPKLDSG